MDNPWDHGAGSCSSGEWDLSMDVKSVCARRPGEGGREADSGNPMLNPSMSTMVSFLVYAIWDPTQMYKPYYQ